MLPGHSYPRAATDVDKVRVMINHRLHHETSFEMLNMAAKEISEMIQDVGEIHAIDLETTWGMNPELKAFADQQFEFSVIPETQYCAEGFRGSAS
jgi:hypothetical protein